MKKDIQELDANKEPDDQAAEHVQVDLEETLMRPKRVRPGTIDPRVKTPRDHRIQNPR